MSQGDYLGILIYLVFLILSLLITWEIIRLVQRKDNPSENKAMVVFVAALAPLLLALIAIIIVSTINYEGLCYSFGDGNYPCSFKEYIIPIFLFGGIYLIPHILSAWIGSAILIRRWSKSQPKDTPPAPES